MECIICCHFIKNGEHYRKVRRKIARSLISAAHSMKNLQLAERMNVTLRKCGRLFVHQSCEKKLLPLARRRVSRNPSSYSKIYMGKRSFIKFLNESVNITGNEEDYVLRKDFGICYRKFCFETSGKPATVLDYVRHLSNLGIMSRCIDDGDSYLYVFSGMSWKIDLKVATASNEATAPLDLVPLLRGSSLDYKGLDTFLKFSESHLEYDFESKSYIGEQDLWYSFSNFCHEQELCEASLQDIKRHLVSVGCIHIKGEGNCTDGFSGLRFIHRKSRGRSELDNLKLENRKIHLSSKPPASKSLIGVDRMCSKSLVERNLEKKNGGAEIAERCNILCQNSFEDNILIRSNPVALRKNGFKRSISRNQKHHLTSKEDGSDFIYAGDKADENLSKNKHSRVNNSFVDAASDESANSQASQVSFGALPLSGKVKHLRTGIGKNNKVLKSATHTPFDNGLLPTNVIENVQSPLHDVILDREYLERVNAGIKIEPDDDQSSGQLVPEDKTRLLNHAHSTSSKSMEEVQNNMCSIGLNKSLRVWVKRLNLNDLSLRKCVNKTLAAQDTVKPKACKSSSRRLRARDFNSGNASLNSRRDSPITGNNGFSVRNIGIKKEVEAYSSLCYFRDLDLGKDNCLANFEKEVESEADPLCSFRDLDLGKDNRLTSIENPEKASAKGKRWVSGVSLLDIQKYPWHQRNLNFFQDDNGEWVLMQPPFEYSGLESFRKFIREYIEFTGKLHHLILSEDFMTTYRGFCQSHSLVEASFISIRQHMSIIGVQSQYDLGNPVSPQLAYSGLVWKQKGLLDKHKKNFKVILHNIFL